ncbi:MAG TPA: protein-tyrosine-phosphatase, partial [Muricauda sp.]|nr:protein-tyrosine-phosphatase [Allomuricauda sp.]
NPPDKRSVAVAKKHGLNINHQKCRKFSKADFSEFDHIYVMDRSNYSDVASLAANQEQASKVKLLLSEVELGIKEVPDPYYGGDNGFENVYQMIDRACEEIAKKLN